MSDYGRLNEIAGALLDSTENGAWTLIEDPELRRIVGEYIADACHSVALAGGLHQEAERISHACPVRLAKRMPTWTPEEGRS